MKDDQSIFVLVGGKLYTQNIRRAGVVTQVVVFGVRVMYVSPAGKVNGGIRHLIAFICRTTTRNQFLALFHRQSIKRFYYEHSSVNDTDGSDIPALNSTENPTMKPSYLYTAAALTSLAHSQLMVPLHKHRGGQAIPPPLSMEEAQAENNKQQQQPMGPVGPALPPDAAPPVDPPSGGGGGGGGQGPVILSDVMGRDRSINIFAGFIRDIESAARRLDDSGANSTVLAPLNSAVEALPRKPWEDPRDYGRLGADAYEGDDGQERAQRNLRRFVEAHIVPKSPWAAGERLAALDGGAGEVWWEEKDGVKLVRLSLPLCISRLLMLGGCADVQVGPAWEHRGCQCGQHGSEWSSGRLLLNATRSSRWVTMRTY